MLTNKPSARQLAKQFGFNVDYFASMKKKTPKLFAYIFKSGEVNEKEFQEYLDGTESLFHFFKDFVKDRSRCRKYINYKNTVECVSGNFISFEKAIKNANSFKNLNIRTIANLKEIYEKSIKFN